MVNTMNNEYKEYVVGLKKFDDPSVYNSIWSQIEKETIGVQYIPDQAIGIANERVGSYRLCHYYMTDTQADTLRNHPFVEVVEIPAYNRPNIKIGLRTVQTGNFNKSTVSNGDNLNWGLIRHSITPNAYDTSGITTASYNYFFDGTGVDVVVHDTGLQVDHPEFTDVQGNSRVQLINWYDKAGIPGRSNPAGLYHDSNGHGTHVGGIIAGKTFGWAKNSHIYVMPVLGLADSGFDQNECFDLVKLWHRNKPIDPATGVKRPTVVNMSWGYSWGAYGYLSGNYRGQDVDSLDMIHGVGIDSLSIRLASVDINVQEMVDEGIIVCTAAGNANAKIDIPGGVDYDNYFIDGTDIYYYHRGMSPTGPGTITVGCLDYAVDSEGNEQKTTFSNAGPGVEIFAAGHHIMSACSNEANPFQFPLAPYYANSGFKQSNISGTSMASPQVCGMIALYLQVQPAATIDTIFNWLALQRTQLMFTSGNNNDYTNRRSQWGGNAGIIGAFNLVDSLSTLPRMLDGPISTTANVTLTLPTETTKLYDVVQYLYQTPGRYKYKIPEGITSINVLCIGGGGGGSSGTRAAGGGGGGLRWSKNIKVRPKEILYINVGKGGTGSSNSSLRGNNGGPSLVTRSGEPVVVAGGGWGGQLSNFSLGAGGTGSAITTYKFVFNSFSQKSLGNVGDVIAYDDSIYLPNHKLKDGDIVLYRQSTSMPTMNRNTFMNENYSLYENDLYFVHQSSTDTIKLQHYASTIPGWSSSLLRERDVNPGNLGDPSYDGTEAVWTNNPGTYNPDGPAVDLKTTGSITYKEYDYLFKVVPNSIRTYGVGLVASIPQYFFGQVVSYLRIWGVVWDLDFGNIHGGDGGHGGIDWSSAVNNYSTWYYCGGGGGAGAYGFERRPISPYSSVASGYYDIGTSNLNSTKVTVDNRDITFRGEGGSGSSDYYWGSTYSSLYSQKPMTGIMYGGTGGGSGTVRGGGGGGTGPAKFNDATYYSTLDWYHTVGYTTPQGFTNEAGSGSGSAGKKNIGDYSSITSSSVTVEPDSIDSVTVVNGGSGYQSSTLVVVRPPRMYMLTADSVEYRNPSNVSSIESYSYYIRIPNHGYAGGEFVAINSYDEDNLYSLGGSITYSGIPYANDLGDDSTSIAYGFYQVPTAEQEYRNPGVGRPNQPITVGKGTGYYPNGYKWQRATYWTVEVWDQDYIRLYSRLNNRTVDYVKSISGTVKIFNATWWNWPSVHATITNGTISAVTVDYKGMDMYNVDYPDPLAPGHPTEGRLKPPATPLSFSIYGSGTGAVLSATLNPNFGKITALTVVSTKGFFTPPELEIYCRERHDSRRGGENGAPRFRLNWAWDILVEPPGGGAYISGTSKQSLDFFNTNLFAKAYVGGTVVPTIHSSVVENQLIVEMTGDSYAPPAFLWGVRIKTPGENLSAANGSTGAAGGHGGKYGGGGGGGVATGGNGADGCVFISLGNDDTWPSIRNTFGDYDTNPIGDPTPVGEPLTPFEEQYFAQIEQEQLAIQSDERPTMTERPFDPAYEFSTETDPVAPVLVSDPLNNKLATPVIDGYAYEIPKDTP